MDPNACLVRLVRAIEANDRDEIRGAACDLRGWISCGGFLPEASAKGWCVLLAQIEGSARGRRRGHL